MDRYIPVVSILLPALAVALPCVCVWLAVRIANRRERWAKWTAVGTLVAFAYPLSFGPACWVVSWIGTNTWKYVEVPYRPIWNLAATERAYQGPIKSTVCCYAKLGGPQDCLLADVQILKLKFQAHDRRLRARQGPYLECFASYADIDEP